MMNNHDMGTPLEYESQFNDVAAGDETKEFAHLVLQETTSTDVMMGHHGDSAAKSQQHPLSKTTTNLTSAGLRNSY